MDNQLPKNLDERTLRYLLSYIRDQRHSQATSANVGVLITSSSILSTLDMHIERLLIASLPPHDQGQDACH